MIWLHENNSANAAYGGGIVTLGDGNNEYYPFSSLDVIAHEISHGFTEQHSGLQYFSQSGGLNESFSDMASKAAEYFSTEENQNWNINDQAKDPNKWDRYMDEPTKDCAPGHKPSDDCSIDNLKQ